jgi:hypothetical protein
LTSCCRPTALIVVVSFGATYIPNVVFGLLTAFVFIALVADLLMTPRSCCHGGRRGNALLGIV